MHYVPTYFSTVIIVCFTIPNTDSHDRWWWNEWIIMLNASRSNTFSVNWQLSSACNKLILNTLRIRWCKKNKSFTFTGIWNTMWYVYFFYFLLPPFIINTKEKQRKLWRISWKILYGCRNEVLDFNGELWMMENCLENYKLVCLWFW